MPFPPDTWVGWRGKHHSLTLLSSEIQQLKVEDKREGDGRRGLLSFLGHAFLGLWLLSLQLLPRPSVPEGLPVPDRI